MNNEPISCPSSYETPLEEARAKLELAKVAVDECEQALQKAKRNESNAEKSLLNAESQFDAAKKRLDAAKAKCARAHENRLRKNDEYENACAMRQLMTVDEYCLDFKNTFISQETDADKEKYCMGQLEYAEGALTGLHDALLRYVTPLFDGQKARIVKGHVIWQCWSNMLYTLGEDFPGGEELLSTIDRYLHLWCENRVSPRPREDAKFRQMVDTEWAAVRRGLSEFRDFLHTRGGCAAGAEPEAERAGAKAETVPQTPSATSPNEIKEIMGEGFADVKRYIARRTRTHKKGTAPGPKMTQTHYKDLKRVHEYVKQGHSVNKACGIVDAENKERSGDEAHYGSAESMRSEYPKWLERERRAGREV